MGIEIGFVGEEWKSVFSCKMDVLKEGKLFLFD